MKDRFEFYSPVKIEAGIGITDDMVPFIKPFTPQKIAIICGPHFSKGEVFVKFLERVKSCCKDVTVISETAPEPDDTLINRLSAKLKGISPDLVIGIGGGSVLDITKAICMLYTNEGSINDYLFGGSKTVAHEALPMILIPTTAGSGSEVSASCVIGDSEKNVKLSVTSPLIFAKYALLDPQMQVSMSPKLTASTGMDAMTHAIEAYTSRNSTFFSDMYAVKAIKTIARYLPICYKNPDDLNARLQMSISATIAAISFLSGGLGLVHGISQTIGGIYHTAHGITNAILLPYVMKYNYEAAPDRFEKIETLLSCGDTDSIFTDDDYDAPRMIKKLNRYLNVPEHLSGIGVSEDGFDEIIKGTMEYRLLPCNPREASPKLIRTILEKSI